MNSRGNEIWLGGIVDRDLLLLSTKGICFWLGRMGDPQAFVFQQWSERERELQSEIMVDLTLTGGRRKVYIGWVGK